MFDTSKGYDENNPCDAVIQAFIFEGEYIQEEGSWIYLRLGCNVFRILRETEFSTAFYACEMAKYELFEKYEVNEIKWKTVWCRKKPSSYAMKEAKKAFDRKRGAAWRKIIKDSLKDELYDN